MNISNNTFNRTVGRAVSILLLVVSVLPYEAIACSVCYGEPDSPAAKGLTWAIVSLGLIVGVVISGVVAFFVQANRNSTQLDGNES